MEILMRDIAVDKQNSTFSVCPLAPYYGEKWGFTVATGGPAGVNFDLNLVNIQHSIPFPMLQQ